MYEGGADLKIRDYKCKGDDQVAVSADLVKSLGLTLPEGHKHADSIAKIGLESKKAYNKPFCELPFCHTVEAEAMGGIVNYGDYRVGPRAAEYICKDLEEVLNLNDIDFSKGRISEVLKAISYLSKSGEKVCLEIAGPITVLNGLIDLRRVFRAMRKDKELVLKVYDKIHKNLLEYAKKSIDSGVYMISYADSSAGLGILGPKMSVDFVNDFTYGFLKDLENLAKDEVIVHLCPKTSLSLVDTLKADFIDTELPMSMTYGEAIDYVKDMNYFVGQMCINNLDKEMKTKKIKLIKLK